MRKVFLILKRIIVKSIDWENDFLNDQKNLHPLPSTHPSSTSPK